MQTELFPVEIRFSRTFTRKMKELKKRYRSIDSDLKNLIGQLQQRELPGDQIQGVAGYTVYKARLRNSDANKGSSGGYRIIYWLVEPTLQTPIILLTIYSKSDQADIGDNELIEIIREETAR